jgi:hypothetical protein
MAKKACCGFRSIVKGFSNLATGKEKKIGAERMKICKACDQKALGICLDCGCVLRAKTRNPDEFCGIGRWQAV